MYAPLLIGGLAASLAGTGMQIAGNAQSQNALAKTRGAEAQQQQQFQQKAQAQVNQSLPQSTVGNEQAQINTGAGQRYDAYKALQTAVSPASAPAGASAASDANSPTAQAAARSSAAGNGWSDLQARAQGQMGGISDMENQQNIKNALTMGNLGETSAAAGDAASIYPLEQQVALQKGDQLNGWGSLLSSLGSLSMMAGATMPGNKKPATTMSFNSSTPPVQPYNPWNLIPTY